MQNMTAFERRSVFKRSPTDPGCPSSILPLPDNIGKIFHPSQLGHEVMAAFALAGVADGRAKNLGLGKYCPNVQDAKKTCYSDQGSKAYASGQALNNNINDFCQWAKGNLPKKGGQSISKNYYVGAPDEYTMIINTGSNLGQFDENHCRESFGQVINNCDVPVNGKNPLNWKFGGRYDDSEWGYIVNIHRTNRPFPPPDIPFQGFCHGQYYLILSSYQIKGGGWSGWDWGQKTLYPSITACVGSSKHIIINDFDSNRTLTSRQCHPAGNSITSMHRTKMETSGLRHSTHQYGSALDASTTAKSRETLEARQTAIVPVQDEHCSEHTPLLLY
jgi:hypothetical protein